MESTFVPTDEEFMAATHEEMDKWDKVNPFWIHEVSKRHTVDPEAWWKRMRLLLEQPTLH